MNISESSIWLNGVSYIHCFNSGEYECSKEVQTQDKDVYINYGIFLNAEIQQE